MSQPRFGARADRRSELRRVDDVRQLLQFCRDHGLAVPARAMARLDELGIDARGRRPSDVLAPLAAIEARALETVETDRRRRARRML